jgi:hypothetical protein
VQTLQQLAIKLILQQVELPQVEQEHLQVTLEQLILLQH